MVLQPLGQRQLLVASQERNGAHLTEVQAQRIVRSAGVIVLAGGLVAVRGCRRLDSPARSSIAVSSSSGESASSSWSSYVRLVRQLVPLVGRSASSGRSSRSLLAVSVVANHSTHLLIAPGSRPGSKPVNRRWSFWYWYEATSKRPFADGPVPWGNYCGRIRFATVPDVTGGEKLHHKSDAAATLAPIPTPTQGNGFTLRARNPSSLALLYPTSRASA